jgi:hypothetical protein
MLQGHKPLDDDLPSAERGREESHVATPPTHPTVLDIDDLPHVAGGSKPMIGGPDG